MTFKKAANLNAYALRDVRQASNKNERRKRLQLKERTMPLNSSSFPFTFRDPPAVRNL
jgi:hypothetical protein